MKIWINDVPQVELSSLLSLDDEWVVIPGVLKLLLDDHTKHNG